MVVIRVVEEMRKSPCKKMTQSLSRVLANQALHDFRYNESVDQISLLKTEQPPKVHQKW